MNVFDHDIAIKMKKDDPLGDVTVPLDMLGHQDSYDFNEVLPTQGSILFTVTWTPVAAHMLQKGTLHVQLLARSGAEIDG